jgi:hypothetical protein
MWLVKKSTGSVRRNNEPVALPKLERHFRAGSLAAFPKGLSKGRLERQNTTI